MSGRSKNRVNANGRSKYDRFVAFSHSLLESLAYRSLNCAARCLLIEFDRLGNPNNNGLLWLSVRDVARLMGVADKKTAQRALDDLIDRGFLVVVRQSSFDVKAAYGEGAGRARVWRLTWEPIAGKSGPTREFADWRPTADHQHATDINRRLAMTSCGILQGRNRTVAGKDCTPVATIPATKPTAAGGESCTAIARNRGITNAVDREESMTHIGYHGDGRSTVSASNRLRTQVRRWQSQVAGRSQGRLAALSGLHASKLSRFLNNASGRQTLTLDQAVRLEAAIATDEPTSSRARVATSK